MRSPVAWVCASALVLAIGCGRGCGCGAHRDPVTASVRSGLEHQLGVKVASLRCTRDDCEAKLAGGATVHVRLSGDHEVRWESDPVIATGELAARIRTELTGLGVDEPVDCGAPRPPGPDGRVQCALGRGGAAWARVRDDGWLDLEIAWTAEAVRERTAESDLRGLDQLSKALDTDEAEGIAPDDDPEGESDAGATPDAGASEDASR